MTCPTPQICVPKVTKLQIVSILMIGATLIVCYIYPIDKMILPHFIATHKKSDNMIYIEGNRTKFHVSTDRNVQSGCPFLNIDPFDPATAKYVDLSKQTPIDCSKGLPSLVYLEGETLRINTTKVEQTVGKVDYCRYTPLELWDKNDNDLLALKWSEKFIQKRISSSDEFLLVECYNNETLVGETYKARIVEKPKEQKRQADYKRHVKKYSPSETLNVLIVGMDGMSKQNFIRTMPKTRNFILNSLNAMELNKFNKVGDNTFPNVVAFHSGNSQPEIEKKWDKSLYFDVIEDLFLWHHYQQAGYRTQMVFDVTGIMAYHYLKRGWQHPTFDYYSRALNKQIDRTSKRTLKGGDSCVDDLPKLNILQDYILQLATKFNSTKTKPYFSYSFFTDLTHYSQNNARQADHIYLDFFTQLKQKNLLSNTLLIFFSDHGTRFYEFRHTINGKIEVNTPFVYFVFPPWFGKKYPDVMNTFKINQNRLATFFDLNKTLMDLLKFKGKTTNGNLESRGISLFDEIPIERSCIHAGVPMEYCNCKLLSNDTVPVKTSTGISKQLLSFINHRTVEKRQVCALLYLKTVHSVIGINTNESAIVPPYYQATIETTPGGGIYEALLKYNEVSGKTTLVGKIVRLNFYKGQDHCVKTLDLKPYCYCIK